MSDSHCIITSNNVHASAELSPYAYNRTLIRYHEFRKYRLIAMVEPFSLCMHRIRGIIRPRHQGGAHGGRAPAKIVRAPAKITGLIVFHLRVNFIRRYSDFSFHINNKCVSSFI